MSVKQYKYSIANKWNGDATSEIIKAVKFFGMQIKKGWTPQEALHQVEGHYGYLVYKALCESFKRCLTK